MAMTREEFEQKIGTVLRAHGAGVTADLTDELLAYWNGHAVAYVLICAEPPDTCFEEFAMDDVQWANWRSWLEAWIARCLDRDTAHTSAALPIGEV
jgi:hypothetical protein